MATIAKQIGQKHRPLGGEMEINPEFLYRSSETSVNWNFDSYQTVSSGRTALKLIARLLKDKFSGGVLLPAYLCHSVVQPFSEEGVAVDFYAIHGDLTIDLEDLAHQVERVKPAGVLFINYFGFLVSECESRTLRKMKDQCWVIEDCAQGSLIEHNEPVAGRIGDFVITSFRKYLPVPDGGLVINNTETELPSLEPSCSRSVRHRFLGKLLRFEAVESELSKPGLRELEKAYLDLFAAGEADLDACAPLEAMSLVSERILGTLDLANGMERRRRNYSFISQAFAQEPELQSIGIPVQGELPQGVSPLVFPIRIEKERRDRLQSHLTSLGVFCPVHWPLPPQVDEEQFPEAHWLSHQILGLPIDQRYCQEDMQSLAERLTRAWAEIS